MEIYIDEAGRWPLAGPLYSWLILIIDDKNLDKMWFRDSKQISEKKREECLEKIRELRSEKKIFCSYGISDHKEIDKYGMTRAQNLSITRWVWNLLKDFYFDYVKDWFQKSMCWCDKITQITIENLFNQKEIRYQDVKNIIEKTQNIIWKNIKLIIDGKNKFWLDEDLWIEVETIIDGDDLVTGISMASIVAKVNRDEFMKKMYKKYPKYSFEKHKWYGTKLHMEMIEKYWICPIHRKLFLKNLFPDHKIKKFKTDFVVFSL